MFWICFKLLSSTIIIKPIHKLFNFRKLLKIVPVFEAFVNSNYNNQQITHRKYSLVDTFSLYFIVIYYFLNTYIIKQNLKHKMLIPNYFTFII